MEKVEKCTVAMLEEPCSQHFTANVSRLKQLQSAIISVTTLSLQSRYICFVAPHIVWHHISCQAPHEVNAEENYDNINIKPRATDYFGINFVEKRKLSNAHCKYY